MARTVDTGSTFEQWRQNYNDLATDVGDPTALTTGSKDSLVNAVNFVMDQYFFFQDFDFDGSDGASSNTVFSGVDNYGNTLQYMASKVLVYKNGLLLRSSDDYIAINGTSVTLTVSAANGDVIRISSYTGSYTTTPAGQESLFNWQINGANVYNSNTGSSSGLVFNADADDVSQLVTAPTVANSIQFEGATYHNDTLTVGVDDTGHDVKFFGATAGSYLLWDENVNSLLLTDSTPIKIGDSQDLQIYHDGSNSYIKDAGTGALRIVGSEVGLLNAASSDFMVKATDGGEVQLYFNGAEKLNTLTGGIEVTGDTDTDTLTVSGNATIGGTLGVTGETTLATHLNMGDSDIIKLGASADLQIYHDGSNSYIKDSGTGALRLVGNQIIFRNAADGETQLHCSEDGAVILYYDNAAKLATVAGGINVTGDTDTDSLTVSGATALNGGLTMDTNKFTVADTSGNTVIAGTLGVTGVATLTARSVHSGGITIVNDGQIGSVGDADSMAIASGGVVTFTQKPVLPADTIDSQHYTNGSIDPEHLAAAAVDSGSIATGAIDLAHMSVNSIDSDQYVNGSIDSVHIANNAIDATRLNIASDSGHADEAIVSDGSGGYGYAALVGANTTYSQSAVASGDNVNLRLTSSTPANDDILVTAGTGITVSSVSAAGFTINASAAGTPTVITVADTTDTTSFVSLFESATGDLGPKTDAGLTYNAGTGVLTATGFAGPLTGNVTGNTSGSSGSTTGNAATATALASGRTIGMTGDVVWTSASFTGSGNVTGSSVIQTDAVDIAMLSASGSAGSSTFLRGDNTWATPTDTNTQLSNEQVQDIVGAMFTSNTETRITATYQDGDGTIDLVVDDLDTDTNTWRGVTAGGNTLASNETLAFTAGTNVSITESGGAVTINSTDQYSGTTTASNSQTFTNKAGNISQWTNNSNYSTTTGTLTPTGTVNANEFARFTGATTLEARTAAETRSDIGAGTSNLALGSSSSTAYRGDRGTTAYDHSQASHAPSNATTNTGTVTGTGTDDYYARWTSSSGLEGRTVAQVLSDIGAAASSHGTHLDLGTGSGNAHRGDHGAAAYTHSQATHAPTNATTNTGTVTSIATGTGIGGGTITSSGTLTNTGVTSIVAGSNISISGATGAVTVTGTDTNTVTTLNSLSGNFTMGAGIGISTRDLNVAVNASGVSSGLIQDANGLSLGLTPTFTTVAATGDITANTGSDIAMKENIINIPNPLEKISKIGGYMFDWKDHGYEDVHGKGHDTGILAQEIEEILPEIVNTRESGMKAVNYMKLIPLLIESIKELNREVESLKDSKT